jgi:hypothetical protein
LIDWHARRELEQVFADFAGNQPVEFGEFIE